LLSVSATEPVEVAMAAVLPCFWIYREVGAHIYKNATTEGNPYKAWIDTYVGEEFEALVDEAIALCDAAAARSTELMREKMTAAYIFAARLEYDFWNAGYCLHKW
jgi:thiaminase/transcriptional activator TenA